VLVFGWLLVVMLFGGLGGEAGVGFVWGALNYTVAWVLLTFLGYLGIHRFYMGKWVTGLIYLFTGGLFVIGWLYDLWTLNEQVDEINRRPETLP
jgi:hypothetical protein